MTPNPIHAGDDGTTGTLGKGRLPKYHPRIETLGALDEASSALGLARALCRSSQTGSILMEAQRDLYNCMTEIAASQDSASHFQSMDQERIVWLESQIDAISTIVPLPVEFILPGDSTSGAALALARTIVRRAERRLDELFANKEIGNPVLLKYLNRLSSLCFSLELLENQAAGRATTLAKK